MTKLVVTQARAVPVVKTQSKRKGSDATFLQGLRTTISAVCEKEKGTRAGVLLGQAISALHTLQHDCGVVAQICGTLDIARDLIPKRRHDDREALRTVSRGIKNRFCPGHCK